MVDFQPTPWTWVRANAIMTISMAEEKQPPSDESTGKTAEGTGGIQTAGTVTSSGSVRVRLIQQSPTANPKLAEAARKFAPTGRPGRWAGLSHSPGLEACSARGTLFFLT
jgi:hypothetical protein